MSKNNCYAMVIVQRIFPNWLKASKWSCYYSYIKFKYIYETALYERIMFKVGKMAKIRNQYNQVLHLTLDTIWEGDKNTIKHHILESQEVSFQGISL